MCYTKVGLSLHRTNAYRSGNNKVFSHDVTAAILVSQTNPLGVEIFSYAKDFFCYNKFAKMLAT